MEKPLHNASVVISFEIAYSYVGYSNQSYTITATPITATNGQKMYFTDQSGVIRVDTSGSGASVSSTPIG